MTKCPNTRSIPFFIIYYTLMAIFAVYLKMCVSMSVTLNTKYIEVTRDVDTEHTQISETLAYSYATEAIFFFIYILRQS